MQPGASAANRSVVGHPSTEGLDRISEPDD
jgi:hypothetical protein